MYFFYSIAVCILIALLVRILIIGDIAERAVMVVWEKTDWHIVYDEDRAQEVHFVMTFTCFLTFCLAVLAECHLTSAVLMRSWLRRFYHTLLVQQAQQQSRVRQSPHSLRTYSHLGHDARVRTCYCRLHGHHVHCAARHQRLPQPRMYACLLCEITLNVDRLQSKPNFTSFSPPWRISSQCTSSGRYSSSS